MRKRNLSWGVVVAIALLATLTTAVGQAGAANNNPPFEGFTPPAGYSLTVNGDAGAQVVRDGDVLTFELTDHAYNACSEGPTTPGCLSNIAWSPWMNRSYVAPFGTGTNWGFTYDIIDPANDCASDSYTCTVQLNATSNVPCTGLPYIGNIAPLLTYVSGDLGLGFGSSSLPYVHSPRLYLDLGPQDCQPSASLDWTEGGPNEILFDATDSYDLDNLDLSDPTNPVGPGDGIVSYSWSFGDGAISFDPAPIHVYNDPGEYEVSLTVTDDEGDIDIIVTTVEVGGLVDAYFTWRYPDPGDPFTIEFDGTPTISDGEIFFWEWDFGDDEFAFDDPIVTHTYAALGEVDVYLYVEDEFGSFGEISMTVDVGGDIPAGDPSVSSPFGLGFDEGADGESQAVVIPLHLSEPASGPVTVFWSSVAQSPHPSIATLGVDYADESGQVVIPPGDTEGFIDLTVFGDNLDEENETAYVEITGAVGATFVPGALGHAVIIDDDDAPVINPISAAVMEGDSGITLASIDVELSAPSAKTVTVDFTAHPLDGVIVGGDADFAPTSGTITFAPGETSQPIEIDVIGDTNIEPGQLFGAEWAAIRISAPTNAAVLPGWDSVAFLLIVDDDLDVT